MSGFLFQTTRNILCELGASSRVGTLIQQTIGKRISNNIKPNVMLVTDNGIRNAKLEEGCVNSLHEAGFDVTIYSDVVADPPEKYIHEAVKIARDNSSCAIVGMGGGSSMDVAKLVAFLSNDECHQQLSDIYGVNQCIGNRLPLFQIPTTAGTGSEVTPISIITTGTSEKKGVVSPQLLPDYAIIDGNLTASVPYHVAAATGIDAMVHAIEAFTCRTKKNPLSDLLALEALKLLSTNIHTVCSDPTDLQLSAIARSDMLLGSMYAGMAFANAPVGAVHALAYPIGSIFHVPHGLSNALMLPHVIEFNSSVPEAADQYRTLSNAMVFSDKSSLHRYTTDTTIPLAMCFHQLSTELEVPKQLSQVGIGHGDIDRLATEAMKQTRLLPNNPRDVSLRDAVSLYGAAM